MAPSREPIYDPLSNRAAICSPLAVCASNGKDRLLSLLLAAGIPPDRPLAFDFFAQGESASPSPSPWVYRLLHLVCFFGHVDMLRTLLERYSSPLPARRPCP